MGGGKGGGSSSMPMPSPYETAEANIATSLYAQTDPLRQGYINQANNFMNTGSIPAAYNPVYAAGSNAINQQYNVAKENLIGATPRGGALTSGLTGLEMGRAGQLGDLQSQIASDIYSKGYGLASGAPQQAMSGLGNVAGTYGNRASQMFSANQAAGTGMGMMAGSLLGRGLFGGSSGGYGGLLSSLKSGGGGAAATGPSYVADFGSLMGGGAGGASLLGTSGAGWGASGGGASLLGGDAGIAALLGLL